MISLQPYMTYLVQAFLLGDWSRTRIHNHLVPKQTLNHLTKLGCPICLQDHAEFNCCLNY